MILVLGQLYEVRRFPLGIGIHFFSKGLKEINESIKEGSILMYLGQEALSDNAIQVGIKLSYNFLAPNGKVTTCCLWYDKHETDLLEAAFKKTKNL